MKFLLGHVVATRGAIEAIQELGIDPVALIMRHASGDWGDLDATDKQLNDHALYEDGRVLSKYDVQGASFYIITEWDRSVTTLMLTDDY